MSDNMDCPDVDAFADSLTRREPTEPLVIDLMAALKKSLAARLDAVHAEALVEDAARRLRDGAERKPDE